MVDDGKSASKYSERTAINSASFIVVGMFVTGTVSADGIAVGGELTGEPVPGEGTELMGAALGAKLGEDVAANESLEDIGEDGTKTFSFRDGSPNDDGVESSLFAFGGPKDNPIMRIRKTKTAPNIPIHLSRSEKDE